MKFWQRFNKNTFRGIAAALVVAGLLRSWAVQMQLWQPVSL